MPQRLAEGKQPGYCGDDLTSLALTCKGITRPPCGGSKASSGWRKPLLDTLYAAVFCTLTLSRHLLCLPSRVLETRTVWHQSAY